MVIVNNANFYTRCTVHGHGLTQAVLGRKVSPNLLIVSTDSTFPGELVTYCQVAAALLNIFTPRLTRDIK